MKEKYFRATNFGYGDYFDSVTGAKLLYGEHWVVGLEDDDEGYEWRAFTNEQWETIKHLSDEEIYKKYDVAPMFEYNEAREEIRKWQDRWDAEHKPIYRGYYEV